MFGTVKVDLLALHDPTFELINFAASFSTLRGLQRSVKPTSD